MLTNSVFGAKVQKWLRTLRKRNAAVVLATQSQSEIANSPQRDVILESCPTPRPVPNDAAPSTMTLPRRSGINRSICSSHPLGNDRTKSLLPAMKKAGCSTFAFSNCVSRARPKDTALDYAERRGLERTVEPMRKREEHEAVRQTERDHDPIERFKRAQREFIKVAGNFDLNPKAKSRVAELRHQMKSAARKLSKSADLMR
jgi:hypothetical protein